MKFNWKWLFKFVMLMSIYLLVYGCKSQDASQKKRYLDYKPYFNQLDPVSKSKQKPQNKDLDTLVIIHSNLRIKSEYVSDSSEIFSAIAVKTGELIIDVNLINARPTVFDTFYVVTDYKFHKDLLDVMKMEVEANPQFMKDSKFNLTSNLSKRKTIEKLPKYLNTKVFYKSVSSYLEQFPDWFAASMLEEERRPVFHVKLEIVEDKTFLESEEMSNELNIDEIQLHKLTRYILGEIPWIPGDSIPYFSDIERVYFDSLLVVNFDTTLVLNKELTQENKVYPLDSITHEVVDTIFLKDDFPIYEKVDYTIFYPNEKDVYIDMVRVEGGEFTIGAELYDPDESPAMPVKVNSFLISKYEVTNEQFSYFMNDQGVNRKGTIGNDQIIKLDDTYTKIFWDESDSTYKPKQGYANYPVVNVTWIGAQRYCQVVETSSRRGRLPSEAEWEYAARGGRYAKMHYVDAQKKNFEYDFLYAGTNYLPGIGTFIENSYGYCHLVGRYAPNELGIHDMSGNVWEWCFDKYSENYYQRIPRSNPINNSGTNIRSNRGGSWSSDAIYCRVTNRNFLRERESNPYLGFRLYKKW